MFHYTLSHTDSSSRARSGTFTTPHGSFTTPCFMPCGTKGAVKTLTPNELQSVGAEVILSNTYHLMLRPGEQLVQRAGGLHQWMSWEGPMLTDSGGYQVFSLSTLRKVSDEGALFQSHIDGTTHTLTPETCIEIQEALGADMIMVLDECPSGTAGREEVERATKRTHLWAQRCFKARKRSDQLLIPIIQGGVYPDLRKESLAQCQEFKSTAIAIGGVAVGEEKPYIKKVIEMVMEHMPLENLVYLMGVGEPMDMLEAIAHGIDLFDCVLPTRLARHGAFWTSSGRKNIFLSSFQEEFGPLDSTCHCATCKGFSATYLRHLMVEREMLGPRLLTLHNLHFIYTLLKKSRNAIAGKYFTKFKDEFCKRFSTGTMAS